MRELENSFEKVKKYYLGTGKISVKDITFYEKLGYRITGEYPLSEIVIMVIMEKFIDRSCV